MKSSPSKPSRNRQAFLVVFLAIALSVPMASAGVMADDIPHENYDLVGTNLDFLISLLRSSISYSEFALRAMYNESMSDAGQNLTVVREVLIPADLLLTKIRDIAGSYENLSTLLPPFADLSAQMDSFSSMEVGLIESRDNILSAAHLSNLTGDQLLQALDAIGTVNSLINRMNQTIEEMLISANSIVALEVDGARPFTDNELIPLIEKLRDLLHLILTEIDYTIIHDIPWGTTQPFLLLWLSSSEYYLDEQIVGGGYLFYDGDFAVNHDVVIEMDGANLTTCLTSTDGVFSFDYQIPLNSSWLGTHSMRATAVTPNETLYSDSLEFIVLLVPTFMTIYSSDLQVSPDAEFEITASLIDGRGEALGDAACRLRIDSDLSNFTTDQNGEHYSSWLGYDLGFGAHSAQAFYDGELPFAPSSSNVLGFEVNIPTSITLDLTTSRVFTGYFVIGDGMVLANDTERIPDQIVALSIDGVAVDNVTTDLNGQFSFSFSTEGLAIGSHSLKAQLLERDIIWRYSEKEIGFTIFGRKQVQYPFFPAIPGWGGLSPPDTFVYLFIGPNSYYFWLLVLLFAGIMVKTYQISARRRANLAKMQAKLVTTAEISPEIPSVPAPTAEEFALELSRSREGPATPNERIVWYYQRLLSFLTKRDNLPFRTSMTHWEVARLMKTLGYPETSVEKATILFEMALYSGKDLADTDTVAMSATMTNLIGVRRPEVARGV